MAQQGLSYEDAVKGGLVYGTDAQGQRSQYTDMQATPDQQAYARSVALSRNPGASIGSPDNPSYDTPDAQGSPGSYHVTPTGRLSAPAPPPTHLAKEIQGIPYEQAVNDFRPGEGWDNRPTSEALGFDKGVHDVAANVIQAMTAKLPPVSHFGADLQGASPANLITTPLQAGDRAWGADIGGAEQKAKPGRIGQVAGTALAGAPFAFDFDLPAIPMALRPAVQGATMGAVASDAKTPVGRIADIGFGAVGGKLGDMAMGGATGALLPKVRPAAQWAIDNDIRLTPGAITNGAGKSLETGASKGTIAGPMIGSAQRRGIEDFNVATARHVLDGTGLDLPEGAAAGHDLVNQTHGLLAGAFNELAPKLALTHDGGLDRAMSEATNAATMLPAAYRANMDNLISQLPSKAGPINGRTVQDLTAQLRDEANSASQSNDFFAKKYGAAVDKLRSAVEDSLERSNPDHAAQLQALRTAYAKQIRVERAARDAVQEGGVYTPKGLLNAVRSTDQSVRDNATARGDALLQDWANAGKKVLPDALPKPGSIWAHLPELGVALGVGQEAHMPGLAAMLAAEGGLGAMYSEPGRALLQTLMTERPSWFKPLAPVLDAVRPAGGYVGGVSGAQLGPRMAASLPILPYLNGQTAAQSLP